MSRIAVSIFLSILFAFAYVSCKKVEPQEVVETPIEDTGISVPMTGELYTKLSDYRLFVGQMKLQQAVDALVEYEPISSLFTDYALKKRFIYMPSGVKASYVSSGEILDFPVGTMLVKSFYYDNVLPSNDTKILETRIMILRDNGWVFGEYVWNNEQTEAYLQVGGSNVAISWSQNGTTMNTNYRLPSETECKICHKLNDNPIPIGVKPQSLNKVFNYADGAFNQLQRLISMGYLENNLPGNIQTVVDYRDVTQSTNDRLRSYLDINCAHCHAGGKHCDYRDIRLAYSETSSKYNMGLCMEPGEVLPDYTHMNYILAPDNIERSMMHLRLSSTSQGIMMPLLGRTVVHQEIVDLLETWITENEQCE